MSDLKEPAWWPSAGDAAAAGSCSPLPEDAPVGMKLMEKPAGPTPGQGGTVLGEYPAFGRCQGTVVLSRACEQFTGAEIEAVFCDALHEPFAKGREPGRAEIVESITRPVSIVTPGGQRAGAPAEPNGRRCPDRSVATQPS